MKEKVYLPMPHFATPTTPPVYLKHDVEAALTRAGIEFGYETPERHTIRALKEELHRVKEAAKRTEEALRACNDKQCAEIEKLRAENHRLNRVNLVAAQNEMELNDRVKLLEKHEEELKNEVARLLKESAEHQANRFRSDLGNF